MKKKLKFDPTPDTEEELEDLKEGFESEGSYHGHDPEVIAKLQKEMEENEEFQEFLKFIEEADK